MIHTCLKCKKEFKAKRRNRRYCSRLCFEARNEHLTDRKCMVCGAGLITYPNWIKRGGGKFCSSTCHGIFMNRKITKTCLLCGASFRVKPSTARHNASKYCSPKCGQIASRGVPRPSIQGEKAPNWRGGISLATGRYPSAFNDFLKEDVRKRDDYRCALCGITEEEHIQITSQVLSVHHIDYCKENNVMENLITLCHQCHGRTNFNRDYWQSELTSKMCDFQVK